MRIAYVLFSTCDELHQNKLLAVYWNIIYYDQIKTCMFMALQNTWVFSNF